MRPIKEQERKAYNQISKHLKKHLLNSREQNLDLD